MHGETFFQNGSLTIALAMAIGMVAQSVARHVRLPGIVLLLAVGVILGPDGASVILPDTTGTGLQHLVGFAVAIILFEGGLNLRIRHLRHQAKPIRRLVTIGALVTGAGGAVVCKLVMGWSWQISVLFGTLVIVTGPTVITPLIRRIRVKSHVGTILEAEGIFIDAVGATIAVVALEVALTPSATSIGLAIPQIAFRIGVGALVGAVGGAILGLLLHWRYIIPRGLENALTLAFAVAIFQVSNGLMHESGITAAIAAGFVLGNIRTYALHEIAEFKEQLTVLLIGTLFVLLAADVRLDDVFALGWRGVVTVLLLMILVRPLTVAVSTTGDQLTRRDKLFLSWLAPRGIVAAAVASLFAINLEREGIDGGVEMRALVFLTIAMTVTIQGVTGGPLAGLLGVRKPRNLGVLFLGANLLARTLGRVLRDDGMTVAFIDANPEACRAAEEEGFTVYYGNGLDEKVLFRAQAGARTAVVGITGNESVNLLFIRNIHEDFYGPRAYVALETVTEGVTEDMVDTHEARVLFGGETRLGWWQRAIERDSLDLEEWVMVDPREEQTFAEIHSDQLLALTVRREGGETELAHTDVRMREDDIGVFAIHRDYRDQAYKYLRSRGLVPRGIRDDKAAT